MYTRYTVNDLIDTHFYINASYLLNTPLLCLNYIRRPSLINAPHEHYSKILGISKREQNHSIHSVSCLINEALCILSCSKLGETNDGNTMTLNEDTDIDVRIWRDDMDL